MAEYNVYLSFLASFTVVVDAENEDEALDKAQNPEVFSPYSDESLKTVEFSDRPMTTDVEELY